MIENYPSKQKFIKCMFFVACSICIIQFFVIAWMSGRMEFAEYHIFDLNKRVLNIENALHLEKNRDGE